MHVVQTAAVPPNHGRISRATSGCTMKSRNEERKIVAAWIMAASDALGERGSQSRIGGRGQCEQTLLRLGRDRQSANERREARPVEPLAARHRFQLLVAVRHAMAAH